MDINFHERQLSHMEILDAKCTASFKVKSLFSQLILLEKKVNHISEHDSFSIRNLNETIVFNSFLKLVPLEIFSTLF